MNIHYKPFWCIKLGIGGLWLIGSCLQLYPAEIKWCKVPVCYPPPCPFKVVRKTTGEFISPVVTILKILSRKFKKTRLQLSEIMWLLYGASCWIFRLFLFMNHSHELIMRYYYCIFYPLLYRNDFCPINSKKIPTGWMNILPLFNLKRTW